MPSLLLHLLAVERLSIHGQQLAPELSRALVEDVEYARLGAALPDLPLVAGLRGGLAPFKPGPPARFAKLFHERAPATLSFKLAELVANGALVGHEAGLAFVSGFLTHVCVDRAFAPVNEALVSRLRAANETPEEARARIAFAQAVWLQRDFFGQDLIGDGALRTKMQMVKRPGLPRGMGRGLYELLRVACQSTFGEAPTKDEVDSWVRGGYFYSFVLSSPLGRMRATRATAALGRAVVYRGKDADVPATLDRALDEVRVVLERVRRMIRGGRFTPRTYSQWVEALPDSPLLSCAA